MLSLGKIELSSAHDSKAEIDKQDEKKLNEARAKYQKIKEDGGPWVLLFTENDESEAKVFEDKK